MIVKIFRALAKLDKWTGFSAMIVKIFRALAKVDKWTGFSAMIVKFFRGFSESGQMDRVFRDDSEIFSGL